MKTRSRRLRRRYRCPVEMALALVVVACSDVPSQDNPDISRKSTWYVSAGVAASGDGSEGSPFASLADAEDASGPGDVIYLVATVDGAMIDGGIALKPQQNLIGLGTGGWARRRCG